MVNDNTIRNKPNVSDNTHPDKGSKKKSTIFSGIHSLAKNSQANIDNNDLAELNNGVMGLSIPIPYERNISQYYSLDTYDDEYKQYLEEEDKFTGNH